MFGNRSGGINKVHIDVAHGVASWKRHAESVKCNVKIFDQSFSSRCLDKITKVMRLKSNTLFKYISTIIILKIIRI